jgi:hypothetical protein
MFGRMLVMLVAVGVILGLFFGFQTFKAGMFKQFLAAAADRGGR